MSAQDIVFEYFRDNDIKYECYFHPESPTIEIAKQYWKDDGSCHCKNLFFRNHKGNRHYLVCFDCNQNLDIHTLEQKLKQGKLSFASPERMKKYLDIIPGSVSPFGLINDKENHVHLFLDQNIKNYSLLSFHPNDNKGTVVITLEEFEKYLSIVGNTFEYLSLY